MPTPLPNSRVPAAARSVPSPAPPAAGQGQPGDRQIVSDTGKLSGATGASYLVNLVGGIIIARILDPALYGIWKSVQLAGTYSAFSNIGATYGIDRSCPSLVSRGRFTLYRRIVASSLIFSVLMASAIAAGVLFLALPLQPSPQQTAYIAFAIFVLLQPFYQHGEASLNVEKKFGVKARVTFISTFLRVTASIAAAYWLGLTGVLAVFLVVLGWSAWYMVVRTRLRLDVRALRFEAALLRRLIRVGLPITLLVFGEQFFLTVDKWIVLGRLGETMMGLYQMAIFPLPILLLVPFALRQVVTMDIYDKFGRTGDLGICRDVFERSVTAIALGVPLVIGAVWFGVPWLIQWFLESYLASIPVLKAHAILIYPMLLTQTAFAIAVIAKREASTVRALLVGGSAAALLSLLWTLSPNPSMMGILLIHGAGWTIFGVAFTYRCLRWIKASHKLAMRRTIRWFLPMVFLAVELPAIEWALRQLGFVPHSFLFAVTGGLIHLFACLPFLFGLEQRTRGISHAWGMVRRRIQRT